MCIGESCVFTEITGNARAALVTKVIAIGYREWNVHRKISANESRIQTIVFSNMTNYSECSVFLKENKLNFADIDKYQLNSNNVDKYTINSTSVANS